MATNNMHNLTTLIKRLEAATLRLEDIASSTIELPRAVPALQHTLPTPSPGSTPSPATALPPPPDFPSAPAPVLLPESIEEFDGIISQVVEKYTDLSSKIGGPIAEQAGLVLQGFHAQRKYLLTTTKAKKPAQGAEMSEALQVLLHPIDEAVTSVTKIKDDNRGSPFFTQLSTVSEGMLVLAWVAVDNKPHKHIEECLGSAKFFGNRVLKEFKDKDSLQVQWLHAFVEIFIELTNYVKTFFPNGLTWNPQGQDVEVVVRSAAARPAPPPPPPPPAVGGAPPPPPPPPPPGPPPALKIKEAKGPAAPSGGFDAVFSELNKGEAVTKGLRKVDKSEMTHKNPSLRAGSTVPDGDASMRGKSPAPGKKPKPESMRVKKPSKKELDGNKWTIEHFEKESEPIQIEASISHSILISKCSNTTVIIRGKANAVTVENTARLSLVVDSLVSTVDAVKSTNFALQVLGAVPTVMLDQIDGAQVYFSKESTATKIFSSKSTSINLNVLAGPDEDYKEVPLPSQICSYYDEEKGELVNEIVSHAG